MQDRSRAAPQGKLTLNRFDHFPVALLDVPAAELWRHLPGPSLFHIAGLRTDPLFVSVLLHGNEETGWQAVQQVLREHQSKPLPRSLLLLVGNIAAAKAGVRTLTTQNDYNRTWPGTTLPDCEEARLMREVLEIVASYAPFASIDIHNNTGANPHYACLNRLDEPYLHLARLFGRTIVYFEKPAGVQSAALATLCPAITVECGRVGGTSGIGHAAELVASALALSEFPDHAVPDGDIDLLQTFAILKVPAEASFSFDGSSADLAFRGDLDHLNFAELAPGVVIGRTGGAAAPRLHVLPGGDFEDVVGYFTYVDGEIRLAQPAIPAMLTLDPNAIRLDCLGYLMHRIGRDGARLQD